MADKEEKRNLFLSKAETRVQNIIHAVDIMKTMGSSPNYDYEPKDVTIMISAIKESVDELEKSLNAKFEKSQQKKKFSFVDYATTNEEVATEENTEATENTTTEVKDSEEQTQVEETTLNDTSEEDVN